ncbi:uncharacterized protein METZ01_LOCUS257475 [marine metagenome]|uniref:Uncharacterized protein n=1 Tax=marine metagenome TaxID=408172 RepID=A0A382J1B3_9ZZZZ
MHKYLKVGIDKINEFVENSRINSFP